MHIGRISTRPVESCTAECSAFELADRMRHAHVGDIVVIEYRDGEAIPIGARRVATFHASAKLKEQISGSVAEEVEWSLGGE